MEVPQEDVAVYNVEERILSEEDLMNSRAAYEFWLQRVPEFGTDGDHARPKQVRQWRMS